MNHVVESYSKHRPNARSSQLQPRSCSTGVHPILRYLHPWLVALLFVTAAVPRTSTQAPQGTPDVDAFFFVADLDESLATPARAQIAAAWNDGYAAMLVDLLDLMRRTSMVNPVSWIEITRLAQFLEDQTGQHFGVDVNAWRDWIWSRPYNPHPEYGTFKRSLYGGLTPDFELFFQPPVRTAIRLDEVQWGGVDVNGIPPLDHPRHVTAAEARYLEDDNVVFGLYMDGSARAYPQRILAWHELARDRLNNCELTVIYCTLCGTVIPYKSRVGGKVRVFGTSGLLYQSNKLMFDEGTHSLWSSLDGTPLIGPLVGSGLRLSMLPVVTTTWGEWRQAHPDTTVLSIDTGFKRDYSQGAAYRQYFADDALMFAVSKRDLRLRNKAEVLALRLRGGGAEQKAQPVAIAAGFLLQRPVYHVDLAEPHLVIITSPAGANRAYQSGQQQFVSLEKDGRMRDAKGRFWIVGEDGLQATFDRGLRLPRVPAHRAFWFGWYAQHPDTLLIK